MTTITDHGAADTVHIGPVRQSLTWHNTGTHLLISDHSGEKPLAEFAQSAGTRPYVLFNALPPAKLRRMLTKLAPNHLRVIGRETFLQEVSYLTWGISLDTVQFERVGPDQRDVLCLHCRQTCKGVTKRIHFCDCGTALLVRDHFSARRGLYHGAPLPPDSPFIEDYSEMLLS